MDMISWGIRMMTHSKEMREFRLALIAIQPIMTDPLEPREKKREALNMMVNELSDSTFKLTPIIEQILTIINMKEDVCREYPDSEAQTDGILEWLPRMSEHREMLLDAVRQHRREYGLEL